MRVHIVTTIENRPDYAAMAELWAFSIRTRAGAWADADISLASNDTLDPVFAQRMLDRYGVRCYAMPRIDVEMRYMNKYNALALPGVQSADWLMFMDSDTLVARPLDELSAILAQHSSVPTLHGCNEFPATRVHGLDRLFDKFAPAAKGQMTADLLRLCPLGMPYFNGGLWILPARLAPEFQQGVLQMTRRLFSEFRAGGRGPLHWAKVQWNRNVYKSAALGGLVIKPYFPKFYSDQMALALCAVSMGWRVNLLSRAFNWTNPWPASPVPELPIGVLHYVGSLFQIDRARLLTQPPDAALVRASSPGLQPGWDVLLQMIADFQAAYGKAN